MSLREIALRASRILATALAAVALVANIHAATVTVTTTADSGAGSLRAALAAAAEDPTIDIIDATELSGTITLTSGELVVDSSVAILGPGAASLTVDANQTSRVFHITPGHTVTLDGLTIVNGLDAGVDYPAYNGGGIYNDCSDLTVSNCTFSNNSAGADYSGGAIFSSGEDGSAVLTVMNCTFNDNVAATGGGIANNGYNGSAVLRVANSTFSSNYAYYYGTGVMNFGLDGSAVLTVTNCTLIDDRVFGGDGGIYNWYGQLEIGSTILQNCPIYDHEDAGEITSRGYNLTSDLAGGDENTGPGGLLNAIGDQRFTYAMLGPLADNGGPTPTRLPQPGSPAIDKGSSAGLVSLGITSDQRGFARILDDPAIGNATGGDGSDIGAVETQPPLADLDLAVSVDSTSAKQGEMLTYTITVLNIGPDEAANVVVTDVLSDGTTYVSAQANKGTVTAPAQDETGVVTWNIGDMQNGDSESAELVVTVVLKPKGKANTVTNVATVVSDVLDPYPDNNTAAVSTSVSPGKGGGKNK